MTITIDATYEDGVLKPAQPLPLSEHAQVRVTVEDEVEVLADQKHGVGSDLPARPPIWERILALTADAPPEELDKLPIDGASQHDHYIYGLPKRRE